MERRQLVEAAIHRKNTGVNPFWLGNPADDTKNIYAKELGIDGIELEKHDGALYTSVNGLIDIELAKLTNSDLIWFSPDLAPHCYEHPEGKPMWDCYGGKERLSLTQPGVFADVEDVAEIEAFDWPDPALINFDEVHNNVVAAYNEGFAVFGGMWSPFFHVMSDFFGMDNYFMKMYTDPDVVIAATERIVDFYLEANELCLSRMSKYLTAGFFGNDLGSQLNMMMSPECYKKFILPYLTKIVNLIKKHELPVAIHMCGAISSIIPSLVDMGVDVLHPIQAKACGMEPDKLQREFGNDLVFMGGVDTQELLPFKTVRDVELKVEELRKIFGPNFIVSPCHECILPNVSLDKVMAMSKSAKI